MIEIGKTYRLASGWRYRLGMVDGGGECPVKGWYNDPSKPGEWLHITHTADGRFNLCGSNAGYDLVEVRPRKTREVWVTLYPRSVSATVSGDMYSDFHDKPEARKLIIIEYEVGEGL